MNIKERWVSWEEFDLLFPGLTSTYIIDFQRVGGLTEGSIPFGDALGMLAEYNTGLFFDETNTRLGVGTGGPVCTGHLRAAVCPAYAGLHPDTVLLLENDDNVTLQFQCATTGEARIRFCDDDFNPSAGMIDYEFSTDEMQFGVATSINMYLSSIGLGLGLTPTNPLHVAMPGTDEGGLAGNNEVVARFRNTLAAHTAISIDALAGRDPTIFLAENGEAMWDIRSDASDSDKFQIRYQGLAIVNRTDFIIDTSGNIEISSGNLSIRSQNELRFYDNGNYVGFEAPALGADQIWTLPDADGGAGSAIITDGGGALSFTASPVLVDGDFGSAGFMGTDGAGTYWIVPGGEDTTNYNLWLGTNALDSVSVGDAQYNVAIGYDAGTALTTADGVVAIGFEAGSTQTTVGNNVYIGYRAGKGVGASGQYNAGIGRDALLDITTANYNMAFGGFALQNVQNGSDNVGIGYNAGASITAGGNNVCIGTNSSIYKNKSDSITIGNASGAWDVGLKVVFIGVQSGLGVNGANFSESVHIGYRSGYSPAASGVAIYNTAIGTYSMYSMKTAWNTVAIGYRAGYDITSGNNNVLIGREAGQDITTGASNVCIGYMAGSGQITADSNELWIANSNTATPLIYGEFPNALLKIQATNFNVIGTCNLGDGGVTNYASIATDGTITLAGTARAKKHVVITASGLSRVGGGSPPTDGSQGTFAVLLFDNAATDEAFFNFHMPDNWAAGTDLMVHIHWCPTTNDVGKHVQWEIDWEARLEGEIIGAGSTNVELHDDTLAGAFILQKTPDGTIAAGALAAADMIGIKVSRLIEAADNYEADAGLIALALEYTIDKLGE